METKDLKSAREIVSSYYGLIERALEIVSAPPFYAPVKGDDYGITLTFDGYDAVLSWMSYSSGYGGDSGYDRDSTSFPAATLFISGDELSALREKARAEKEQERAAEARANQYQVEAQDRIAYARLRAKYGDGLENLPPPVVTGYAGTPVLNWREWFKARGRKSALLFVSQSGEFLGPAVGSETPSRCAFAVCENDTWREATREEYEKAGGI